MALYDDTLGQQVTHSETPTFISFLLISFMYILGSHIYVCLVKWMGLAQSLKITNMGPSSHYSPLVLHCT